MKRCLLYVAICLPAFVAAFMIPASLVHAEAPQEVVRAVIGADGIQRVNILGGSYFFRPGHIIVKVNVPVELAVSIEPGIVPHTMIIQQPAAGVEVDETLGTTVKILAFTPRSVGKYSFYCKNRLLFFKSHREKGMEGLLEVIE